MSLIDTPFELLNPKDYDQVVTELQAAKRDLVEALTLAARDVALLCDDEGEAESYLATAAKYKNTAYIGCGTCKHNGLTWVKEPCFSCGSGKIGDMIYTNKYEAKP